MKLPPCDVCKKVVAKGSGYVCVDKSYAMFGYPNAVVAWRAKHVAEGNLQVENGWESMSGAALLDHPEPAEWHVYHFKCDPNPESGNDYWFSVERCGTYPKLIDWTAHLIGKRWFKNTDWDRFLHRVQFVNGQEGAAA